MKSKEEIEQLAELYVWGGVYLSEQEKQQTEIAYMTGYSQCQEDMANEIEELKEIIRSIVKEYNSLNKQD